MKTVSSKRTVVLMGVLLAALLLLLVQWWWPHLPWADAPKATEPPLAGKNTISGLRVERDTQGRWTAQFDYFYTGRPEHAEVDVAALSEDQTELRHSNRMAAQRGQQHVVAELGRPMGNNPLAITTRRVEAEMRSLGATVVRQKIAQSIDWPDVPTTLINHEVATKPAAEVLATAVQLIDTGDDQALGEARQRLERLVAANPQLDAAYVELARVAMKTNRWPDGLRQGQALLTSALQIRPDSVNARILMGYVYVHQGQHKQAEPLFSAAAQAGTPNLWLWTNWGESLAMQGKVAQAMEKYRQALTHPPTGDTYDRAREDAYRRLLRLLRARQDLDGMQALYKQRYEDYGTASCYGAEYGNFLLRERGDTQAAMTLARQAVEPRCKETLAKQVLGMAHYVEWALAQGAERDTLLNQARVLLPMGPALLYQLAAGERTAGAAQKLLAAGESVDQLDNRKYNALAYALGDRDYTAARRLLRLGAKPDCKVDEAQMPVAMLPVLSGDVEALRLFQQAGVDYTKLRFDGASALEYARRIGDPRVIQLLSPNSKSL